MARKKTRKVVKTGSRELIVATAGDILGRTFSNLAAEGLNLFGGKDNGHGYALGGGDPAARLLRTLADGGEQSIPELLEETGVGLSMLLHALRDARDFALVEFDEKEQTVSLTETGKRVAKNVRKNGIRETASRLLGSQ